MRISIFSVLLVLALLPAACRKSSGATEEEDNARVCQGILDNALKEQYPLVQPPALSRFDVEGVDLANLPLPADSHLVVVANLAAFTKSGLLGQAARVVSPLSMAQNVLTFMGLSPGRSVQALAAGVRFGSRSWEPEQVSLAVMGPFSAAEVIGRLQGIGALKTWLPNVDLPPIERDGDFVSLKVDDRTFWIVAHASNVLVVSNRREVRADLSSNADFVRMTAPIPRNTALWFALMEMPQDLPPTAKVVERLLSQLRRFTGYLNMDEKLNVEFQLRTQFSSHQAALQAKEILRLGVSQVTMYLGPRIQKSFSLDGSSDHENVVSRGPFVRLLFRLDRFQVQYLLQQLQDAIRENSWIYN